MWMNGVRATALFLAYAVLGLSGDWAAGLMAREGGSGMPAGGATAGRAWDGGGCAWEAERVVSLPADGAELLRLRTGSGELRVEGRAGLEEIRAVGRACASEEADLEALRLSLEARGGVAELTVRYPSRPDRAGSGYTARMDLTVEVPLGLAADLVDSSGGMEVSGTGALRIDDSSGGIYAHGILGPVDIDDSSGGIELRDVEGNVRIEDGSGEIDVRDVRGEVSLRDGSGSVEVFGVTGGVEVGRDGSGSISVRDVGGDFAVLRDGSGSIRHSGVAGRVDIPLEKRNR